MISSIEFSIRVRGRTGKTRNIHSSAIEKVAFTEEMRKNYTILCPQMSPIHFEILQPAFNACGYNFEVLNNDNRRSIDVGLKYVNNDACYPSLLVVGQIMEALHGGVFSLYNAFSPYANLKHAMGQDAAIALMKTSPEAFGHILRVIEEDTLLVIEGLLTVSGVDGIMLCLQGAEEGLFSDEDYLRFLRPGEQAIVEQANRFSKLLISCWFCSCSSSIRMIWELRLVISFSRFWICLRRSAACWTAAFWLDSFFFSSFCVLAISFSIFCLSFLSWLLLFPPCAKAVPFTVMTQMRQKTTRHPLFFLREKRILIFQTCKDNIKMLMAEQNFRRAFSAAISAITSPADNRAGRRP